MRPSFYLYDGEGDFPGFCRTAAFKIFFHEVETPGEACVAIAPRLTRKLARYEYEVPRHGTLIFHPSALPHRRGPDAIKHAIADGDRVSAATWFWCDDGWDTGLICEQEVVILKPGESAGRAYHSRFVPAGIRALERALRGIASGMPRRVKQDESLATYQGRFGAPPAEPWVHPVELMGP